MERYFDVDQPVEWQLSDKANGCPHCHKHTYTLIFFSRDLSSNADLCEITDPDTLQKVREDFEASAVGQQLQGVPRICGTVVNSDPRLRAINRNNCFGRKLCMMQANLFTLFSISNYKTFAKD